MAQQEGEKLLRRVPEIDLVMGPQYVNRMGDLLEDVMNGNQVSRTPSGRWSSSAWSSRCSVWAVRMRSSPAATPSRLRRFGEGGGWARVAFLP